METAMIDAKTTAKWAGFCVSSLYKLAGSGLFPPPLHIGRSVRWNVRELEEWKDAGCPPVDKFKPARAAKSKRQN
jgi:predicted DNA-binding transcriptional regulator AlpA